MKKIKIFLNSDEIKKCIEMAKKRHDQSRIMKLSNKHGLKPENAMEMDIIGCKGEMAVIKYLKINQEISVNTFKNIPDVGDYEVRSVSKPGYRLIIRENDDKNKIYILVEVYFNYCEIVGYYSPSDIEKYPKETQAGRAPAWFIPQNVLKPITDLVEKKYR